MIKGGITNVCIGNDDYGQEKPIACNKSEEGEELGGPNWSWRRGDLRPVMIAKIEVHPIDPSTGGWRTFEEAETL